MRVAVLAGGNWNNGRNCSPVYFNCNNAPGNANISFLARLIYNKKDKYKKISLPGSLPIGKIRRNGRGW